MQNCWTLFLFKWEFKATALLQCANCSESGSDWCRQWVAVLRFWYILFHSCMHACIRICGGTHALSIWFMSILHKHTAFVAATMTITATLIPHSLCCLGWSISLQSRRGLGPNAAARFHTLQTWWRKKKKKKRGSHTRGGWHLYTNVMRIAVHIVQICFKKINSNEKQHLKRILYSVIVAKMISVFSVSVWYQRVEREGLAPAVPSASAVCGRPLCAVARDRTGDPVASFGNPQSERERDGHNNWPDLRAFRSRNKYLKSELAKTIQNEKKKEIPFSPVAPCRSWGGWSCGVCIAGESCWTRCSCRLLRVWVSTGETEPDSNQKTHGENELKTVQRRTFLLSVEHYLQKAKSCWKQTSLCNFASLTKGCDVLTG